ncbi:MAG TPA: fibronectin type III domain-containing protein, partial [Prolixibacteraceae bacterium]|nr:fibronectin type III domain-containing protein [Prolixibacteraceae bacterium]
MRNTRFYLTRCLSKLHISFMLLCMFLCSIGASAQIFPVTLNVSGNYNFSGSMADLANGSVGNFTAHLTMNDLVVSNRDVYLKINIRGGGIDATSNPNWMLNTPVNISGGETVALSSLDLKEYFSYDNLVGISPNRYNAMLPEGTYTITFEVFDYNNPNVPISNRVFFNFTISHGLPPEIVFPTAAAGELSSNFIFMRWTPAMAYGYNITYQIEYLVDEEKNTDPLAFFHNYMYNTELIENINSTSYNLDLGSLPITGNSGRVIFRVRALATTFTDGQSVSVIQNDGYSQIAWFDFNDGSIAGFCAEITSVSIDPKKSGTNFSTVVWQVESEVECQQYTLSYRPANQPDITPYTFESTELKSQKVEGLEPGQSYLFTVTANCPAQLSSASVTYEQPEPQQQVTNCGEITAFDPLNIENLLTNELKAGDVIYINNLPVVIEALTNGPEAKDQAYFTAVEKLYPKIGEKPAEYYENKKTHTGYGRITFLMPLFQDKTPGVGVVFKDVYIDKNMQMLSGYAETIYKPENWTTQMANMNAFFRGGVLFEKIMDEGFVAHEVYGIIGDTANIIPVFNGDGTVVEITLTYTDPTPGGNSNETITVVVNDIVQVPESEENQTETIDYYIIKDRDNVYYGINLADGSKIPLGRYNPDINEILADINPNKVDYDYKILFSEAEGAEYDFDPAADIYQNNNIYSNHYNKLEDSDDYKLRWKFMQVDGGTDEVSVTIPDHFSDKELKFIITQNNTELAYEAGATSSINLTLMPPPT